ncbi:MAG: hypothetical protein LBS31_13095 [Candidatus Adiutrix sp.]|jgi:hypothetical protein|nr:hypothetical protein [Candidatus Adiutrix sp.]
MNDLSAIEPAAFLDLWREKIFLGQEFLTWLWIVSEINGNLLNIKPQGAIELWFESRLQLESGEGGNKKSVTCLAPGAEWAEAHTALREGKKLTRAKLRVRTEEKEWSLALSADALTPQSVRFPKTFDESEEEGGPVGQFLERAALLSELTAIVESLFKGFLELRLSPAWAGTELPRLNKWLTSQK